MATVLEGAQDWPAKKAGVVPENRVCSPPLSAPLAGTDLTLRLEEILASNSTSHHLQGKEWSFVSHAIWDAGQSWAYSFVLGCTDDSWEDGKAAWGFIAAKG